MYTIYPFVHSEEVGEVIGDFHGIPVRSWDAKGSAVRAVLETRRIIEGNRRSEAKAAGNFTKDHEYVDLAGIIQPSYAMQVSA
jgi:hypothetical protein